jgi:O-antigen/teichoic acid export membrane protein
MIGTGFLFFSAINGYQTGALSGLEAYGTLAKAGVASGIIAIAFISLGAWRGGLNGAVIGLSASALARCALHNRGLRAEVRMHDIRPQYRGVLRQEKAVFFKFALPAAIGGYYSLPMIWLANSFLVRQPGGYGEMAVYSAANNIRILVLFLPNIINSVGLSVLNNEKAKGDINHYRSIFRANVMSIFLVSIGGGLVMGIIGRPILRLFGKDFIGGYFLLWLLLISAFFEGLSIGLYQYIQSQGKIWHSVLIINIPRETFLVVAAYFLVQSYAGAGLAAAYLGSTILGLLLHVSLVATLYRKDRSVQVTNVPERSPLHD